MWSFTCRRVMSAPILAAAVLFAACNPASSAKPEPNRDAVARACMAEMMAAYEGKTYDALRPKIDGRQDSKVFRKFGHKYEVLVSVDRDVEHKPDGILIQFYVYDGDEPPTMTPVHDWIPLRKGEVLHVPKK